MSETTETPVAADEPVVAPAEAASTPAEETAAPAEEAAPSEEHNRIAKLRQAYAETKRQAAQLRAENEALRGQRQQGPNEEVERRARELAAAEVQQREFNKTCNDIYLAGVKQFGKSQFDDSVRAMNETLGGSVPTPLIEALAEAGDAHKVWHYLSENPDTLEDIANLPPHRMGAAVAKLTAKVNAPKAVSKAPPR